MSKGVTYNATVKGGNVSNVDMTHINCSFDKCHIDDSDDNGYFHNCYFEGCTFKSSGENFPLSSGKLNKPECYFAGVPDNED